MTIESLPDFNKMSAQDRIKWAVDTYGDGLIMTSSFGAQAAVMLHMVTQIKSDIPIVFIDTGYLFPETYRFARDLKERLNLNLKTYIPLRTAAHQEALESKRWEQGPEALSAYNLENKVEPMSRAVKELGAKAWLTGLRAEQSESRAGRGVFERQRDIAKINPIIEWSAKDIYKYLTAHGLPYHPLWDQGYVSIGDVHSTKPLTPGMTEEQTRFGGVHRECGLHDTTDRPPEYHI